MKNINNKTFFSWIFPFNTQDESIEISPFYLSPLTYDYLFDLDKIENIKYQDKSEIIEFSIKIRNHFLHSYINSDIEDVSLPSNYFVKLEQNKFTVAYSLLQNFIPDKKDKSGNIYEINIYNCDRNMVKGLIFRYDISFTEDLFNFFEKFGEKEIHNSKTFIESFSPKIKYNTHRKFTGYSVNIYFNPTNDILELQLYNHIINCVDGKLDYKLKEFLTFHFYKYTGNAVDFITYLEEMANRRFNPDIAKNIIYFQKIIKWINSKRKDVSNLTIRKNAIRTSNPSIKLKYNEKNNHIVKLLYQELNNILIESIDFEDFERHFNENDREWKKLQWKGTEPEITYLFNVLNLHNTKKYKLITEHFYDKKNNKEFNNGQLSVAYNKVNTEKLKTIKEILIKVEKLAEVST